jgi:mono/diheme cytochrome c family protein
MLILLVSIAGCGGAGTPTPTIEPIPTPQAVYEQPTSVITPQAATPASETAASADLAQGQRVYETKCISCHGDKAGGMPGKGKNLVSLAATVQEFEDILRTGAKGRLGNEHLYGPSQISPSGVQNLYTYIQSLKK